MEISGKRKRKENEIDIEEEADIEKFSEIVEKFRAPYNWFRAKISTTSVTNNNGDDPKKKKKEEKIIVEDDSKKPGGDDDDDDDDVWMPCFLLQDFEEEEVIKSWKARALVRSSDTAAAPAADFGTIHGGREAEEKEEDNNNNEKLDLRLSL